MEIVFRGALARDSMMVLIVCQLVRVFASSPRLALRDCAQKENPRRNTNEKKKKTQTPGHLTLEFSLLIIFHFNATILRRAREISLQLSRHVERASREWNGVGVGVGVLSCAPGGQEKQQEKCVYKY